MSLAEFYRDGNGAVFPTAIKNSTVTYAVGNATLTTLAIPPASGQRICVPGIMASYGTANQVGTLTVLDGSTTVCQLGFVNTAPTSNMPVSLMGTAAATLTASLTAGAGASSLVVEYFMIPS